MNYDWDLTNIYKTEEDFEKDLMTIEEEIIPSMAKTKGRLNTEEGLCEYCKGSLELERLLQPVYMYAACASDLDKRNLEANKRLGRVMILFQKLGEGTSFAEPEILAL